MKLLQLVLIALKDQIGSDPWQNLLPIYEVGAGYLNQAMRHYPLDTFLMTGYLAKDRIIGHCESRISRGSAGRVASDTKKGNHGSLAASAEQASPEVAT